MSLSHQVFQIKIREGKEGIREFHDLLDALVFPYFENEVSHSYSYRIITPRGENGGNSFSTYGVPSYSGEEELPLILYETINLKKEKG